MHTTIPFTKLSATGNDFILFDNHKNILVNENPAFFQRICQRRTGIGADGILILNAGLQSDFAMTYFNSDGSLGEMCGNGARASAHYAHHRGITASSHVIFDVLGVKYEADVDDNKVQLAMPPPKEIKLSPRIFSEPLFYRDGYANVGVPHYVLFTDDVAAIDVNEIGRKYRYHEAMQPWGTNVNFVEKIDDNTLKIRTYERGVEEETQACGTGTISSVIVAMKHHMAVSPVHVHAPGGTLIVECDDEFRTIYLSGQVEMIYDGELYLQED
ncbi:diaminopimelate epimerase [candidate division KSB1 bacterium]|nr:diaminopimelate epimerase [candidate division KSB1 bacterium]